MSTAREIAVVLDTEQVRERHRAGQDAWWLAITEVLDHVRLPWRRLASVTAGTSLEGVATLVFAAPPRLDEAARQAVSDWVAAGGVVLAVSGPGDLSELFGVAVSGADVTDGHVRLETGSIWTQVPDIDLHAIGGVRLRPMPDVRPAAEPRAVWTRGSGTDGVDGVDGVDEPDSEDGRPAAISTRVHGRGLAIAFGVDLWRTIVRIQQGYTVTGDGQPAADGTAPLDDGILKCEDGLALDFERDRAIPPGEPELPADFAYGYPPTIATPMFHRPQADLWKSVFLQAIWYAAEHAAAPVPWLDYWPAGISAVAHLSHDSDQNVEEDGRAALETFAEADVRVTWCQVFPGGYEPGTYAKVTAAGHEHALHYNAMHDADLARWGWPYIRAQYAWAQAVTGTERIVSNKNHYTRWEGFTEFYRWCERLGIEIDESRGPSKHGTIGFTFGTAHVSFPIAAVEEGNRYLDVLALPLHTQDLAWAGHEANRDVILDGAQSVHGVAHFLFHGPHLRKRPAARKACLELVREARRRGMPWWTAGEINRWERARRGVDLTLLPGDVPGTWRLHTWAAAPVSGAAVLLPVPASATAAPGAGPDGGSGGSALPVLVDGVAELDTVRRHGRDFVQLALEIPAGGASWTLRWS